MANVPSRLTPAAGRRFALTVGFACVGLAALLYWRGGKILPGALAAAGATLLIAGTIVPGHLSPVYRAWMGLGQGVGRITSPIVLGIVYFLVITPIGVVMRLLGKNPLRHRARDGSFWLPVPSGGRSNLDNQF